jgi:hypothetical protein
MIQIHCLACFTDLIKGVKLPANTAGLPGAYFLSIGYMPLDPAYKAGLARHETGQDIYEKNCF